MKPIHILVVFVLLLSACSFASSGDAIQTAIAQTQTAQPTFTPLPTELPTPTLIPLADVNLDDILLLPGDLPTDFKGQQISSFKSSDFSSMPKADQFIQQKFRYGELASDGVTIFLYTSDTDLDNAYEQLLSTEGLKGKHTLYGVGEKGMFLVEKGSSIPLIGGGSIPGGNVVKAVFTCCQALVYIDLFSPEASEAVITSYAKRLDKRLSELMCP